MTDPSSTPPPVTPVWTPPSPYVYGYPYQPMPPRKTNGLAIASMVVSIVAVAMICAWGPFSIFISPVGVVLGHVARHQIKTSGDQGNGLAVTGIIIGWIGVVICLATIAFAVWLFMYGRELFPTPSPTYQDVFLLLKA